MKKNIVLIVDDCEVYQNALQFVVEKEGFITEICADGMKAMIRTNEHMEDVAAILLDIYMPEIDGISLLGHLRSRYPEVPVFVVSGSDDPDDKHAVLNLGAADFFHKPLSAETIQHFGKTLRLLKML